MSDKTKELAKKLHNSEYLNEGSDELFEQAKKDKLLVVYGYSDDSIFVNGYHHDQLYGEFILDQNGDVWQSEADTQLDYSNIQYETVEAVFCEAEYTFIYNTDCPHETFDVLEDGQKYCRGIVIDVGEFINSFSETFDLNELNNGIGKTITFQGPSKIVFGSNYSIKITTESPVRINGKLHE